MTLTRQEINRRAAAARRIVLRRLAEQQPATYRLWIAEAYRQLDADGQP
jgi:hypothetical protein